MHCVPRRSRGAWERVKIGMPSLRESRESGAILTTDFIRIFTHISAPVSPLFAAFVRDFVLVLSRMTVLVLVLDCN